MQGINPRDCQRWPARNKKRYVCEEGRTCSFLKHTFLIYGILEACIFARVLLGGILEMYKITYILSGKPCGLPYVIYASFFTLIEK